jgi:hypothetical protein
MKTMKKWIGLAVFLSAFAITAVAPTGCAGGPKVSDTSVYQGDTFLFQSEKLTVQAHELFLAFYRWEKDWRQVLPASVSRAADFCRLNEEKWINSANALHDTYVANKTPENKALYEKALAFIRTGLGQAAFYMLDQKAQAPNNGLAPDATLKAIGVAAVAPPPVPG